MRILIFVFLCLWTLPLFSQVDSLQLLKDKRKYKNELSFNIKNISTSNLLGSVGVMYKRAYQKGDLIDVNQIRKMRFFIGRLTSQLELTHDGSQDSLQYVDGTINNTASVNSLKAYDNIDISVGFGLERQRILDNVVFRYGMDLILGYAMVEDDTFNAVFDGIIYNHTSTTDRRLRSYQVGLNPFAGLQYFVKPRIAIGFETGIYIGYFESAVLYYGGGPTIPSRGIRTSYNGIGRIDISYIF